MAERASKLNCGEAATSIISERSEFPIGTAHPLSTRSLARSPRSTRTVAHHRSRVREAPPGEAARSHSCRGPGREEENAGEREACCQRPPEEGLIVPAVSLLQPRLKAPPRGFRALLSQFVNWATGTRYRTAGEFCDLHAAHGVVRPPSCPSLHPEPCRFVKG